MAHDHTTIAILPRPLHSSQRAATTNDPLGLPVGLLLTTARGRRWRDLAVAYVVQLGDQMLREDVRARLRSLIWLTLEIEQLHDDRVSNKPVNLQLLLHMSQEQRVALNELGLAPTPPSPKPKPEPPPAPLDLRAHIASRVRGAPP